MMHILDEQSMRALGQRLAKCCESPLIIYLQGELGAGKTTFVRGFLEGLGYGERVKSPTYSLVEIYHFDSFRIAHFDLYRVHDPIELELMGIHEYFDAQTIALIEWPELAYSMLPHPDIVMTIKIVGEEREIDFHAESSQGKKVIE